MITAAVTGVGGGNFASSMTNINTFFPQARKGWALGLNAGGGNIGVPVVQLMALLVIATAGAGSPRLLPAGQLHPVDPGGGGVGGGEDGQLCRRCAMTPARSPRRDPPVSNVDHVVCVYRDVRLVHRVQLRVGVGPAERVPTHPRCRPRR